MILMTPAEKAALEARTRRAGMSTREFVRRLGPSAYSVQVSTSSTGSCKIRSKISDIHEDPRRACPPKWLFAPSMRMDRRLVAVYDPDQRMFGLARASNVTSELTAVRA